MNATVERGAAHRSQQYQVADLLIDVGRQRVTRAGVEISLPKLSFDLLLVLIRAAPNVVSNDELMSRVWPGIVVSPETVSQRVKLLRDTLGDDPHKPRYIAGLRGRGYRLMTDAEPLSELRDGAAVHATAPDIAGEFQRKRLRMRVALGTLTALGLAFFLLITFRPQPRPASSPETATVVGLPPRTVAVLPFDSLSPDPANEYLALGMAEMVLNRLANIEEIVVIARSSSFTFGDANADARTIGDKLRARYLVDGSVQREGDKLRVTANLIDAQSGSQLEAMRFDRAIADIFSVQDEIADRVAGALQANLASATAAGGGAVRSENLDAYLAYLQGRELLEQWTVSGFEEAAQQFERAIALDPKFAAAYAALADAHMWAAWRRHRVAARVGGPEKEKARLVKVIAPLIDKALALDPFLGAAYLSRARWIREDPAQIEADFRKGIELDPANGRGLLSFYEFLSDADRAEEGRRVLDRALLVDPRSARAHYVKAMDFTDSVRAHEQALLDVLKIDPNFTSALTRLGQLRWKRHGEFAEGVKLVERAVAIDPQSPMSRSSAYIIYLDMGDLAAARDVSEPLAESAGNARFQMRQYVGDRREAGEAAYQVPEWLHGHYENYNDAEAIRDLALMTRDYRRAIRFIESECELGEPRKLTFFNARRAVPLAHLLRESGQQQAFARLLEDILAWLDNKESQPRWARDSGRIRANALALQGDRDAALAELAEAFRSGDRRLWWYTIDRDPLYADMRSDPRFQAIAAEARAHAAHQRALLDEMRRKGVVPFRPAPTEAQRSAPTRE